MQPQAHTCATLCSNRSTFQMPSRDSVRERLARLLNCSSRCRLLLCCCACTGAGAASSHTYKYIDREMNRQKKHGSDWVRGSPHSTDTWMSVYMEDKKKPFSIFVFPSWHFWGDVGHNVWVCTWYSYLFAAVSRQCVLMALLFLLIQIPQPGHHQLILFLIALRTSPLQHTQKQTFVKANSDFFNTGKYQMLL